jgi:hypothetical protein
MAVTQGNTPQPQEIRFSPKNRLKLTTPETEYIYNEAVAPLAGAYQYYELVPGGGTSGVIYRFPPGTDFEALEKFEADHPDIQVTFRTNRPAPANAVYAEPMKPGRRLSPSTSLEIRKGAPLPNVIRPQPSWVETSPPKVIEIGPPFEWKSDLPPPQPTYGRIPPSREFQTILPDVLEWTKQQFGEAPSLVEAKKKLKAFGSGAPLNQKMLQEFLPYIPKSDPDIRVHDVRTGTLKATIVESYTADAARRSGMGVWQIDPIYWGNGDIKVKQFLIYPPTDTAKRDEILKILEAYPLGYRGRQYFQEMGRAMGVPEILTNNFVNTFYQKPTIIPEGVTTPAKTESPKWLGLLAVVAIAFIFFKKPAPTQGA